MTFRLRPRAEADIAEIIDYISTDSPTAAHRLFGDLLESCRRLGDDPLCGVERSDIRPRLRLFPRGRYLILYHAVDSAAEIIRVLQGARDWQSLIDKN